MKSRRYRLEALQAFFVLLILNPAIVVVPKKLTELGMELCLEGGCALYTTRSRQSAGTNGSAWSGSYAQWAESPLKEYHCW